jgi:uncharacterized protein YndB with AHSA1/START domain
MSLLRPVSHTIIDHVRAPIEQVFALLTDPSRMAAWLPGCGRVESEGPLKRGARFKARFGDRLTEFEIVDFNPPTTFGWMDRGPRKSSKTFFRLDAVGGATAVTIRQVWTPQSVGAWLRGHLFQKRNVQRQLSEIPQNLRSIVTG